MSDHDSSKNPEMVVIIFAVLIIVAYKIIEYNFEHIAFLWRHIRIAELWLVSWIPDWMPIFGSIEIKESLAFLKGLEDYQVTREVIAYFDGHFSKYFSWIPALITIVLGFILIKKSDSVRQVHDIDSLLKRQSDFFTELKPYVKNNPISSELLYDRDKPELKGTTVGLQPHEWARLSPPLGLEEEAKADSSFNMPIWNGEYIKHPSKHNSDKFHKKADLDIDLARRAFEKQLGQIYQGFGSMKEHHKKLYDFFLPKLSITLSDFVPRIACYAEAIKNNSMPKSFLRLEAEHLLYEKFKADYSKLIKETGFELEQFVKPRNIEGIINLRPYQKIAKSLTGELTMDSHHYINTGLMSLLQKARGSGVIATSKFQWVKSIDRALWYGLDSIGKKVAQVEGAGCFSHWLAETQFKRRLSVPEVTEAVKGFEIYMNKKSED